jgi:hypothetical protein
MEKFVELRNMYNKAGVTIYAYIPNALNESSSDKEIDYAMTAAKALGASSVTVELPTNAAQSKRLGEFASKHKVYVRFHSIRRQQIPIGILPLHSRLTIQ